jgi:hypothetical protein
MMRPGAMRHGDGAKKAIRAETFAVLGRKHLRKSKKLLIRAHGKI